MLCEQDFPCSWIQKAGDCAMAAAEDTLLQGLHFWHGVGGVSTAHTPFLGLCWDLAGNWGTGMGLIRCSHQPPCSALLTVCSSQRHRLLSENGPFLLFCVEIEFSVMFSWHSLRCWWDSLMNRHVPDLEPLLEVQPLAPWQLFAAFPVQFNRLVGLLLKNIIQTEGYTQNGCCTHAKQGAMWLGCSKIPPGTFHVGHH